LRQRRGQARSQACRDAGAQRRVPHPVLHFRVSK
jgi:hypothetical protein